jgi:hypothetical protein
MGTSEAVMRRIAIIVLAAIAVAVTALLFAEPPVIATGAGETAPMQIAYTYAGIRG